MFLFANDVSRRLDSNGLVIPGIISQNISQDVEKIDWSFIAW